MWICPVCDHKNTKNDCCSACGFDRSCSYEEFNTLASIKTGNQSIHLRKWNTGFGSIRMPLCAASAAHLFFTPGKGQEADLRELRS